MFKINHLLIFSYLSILIFFLFPYYSFYSLGIFILLLSYEIFKQRVTIKKSIYLYTSGFFISMMFCSMWYNNNWNGLGIFLPFFIPIAFMLFMKQIEIKNYARILIFFCILFLLAAGQNYFFRNVYYAAIEQMNSEQIFATSLIFLPIFWTGIFEKNIYWKILYLLFVAVLLLIIISNLQLLSILVILYSVLLFLGNWKKKRIYYYSLVFFWIIVLLLLWAINQNLNLTPFQDFSLQLEELVHSLSIHFIRDFSFLGTGVWLSDANNSFHQIYISFGFLTLAAYILLLASFFIAIFSTMRRKNAEEQVTAKILWGYSSSVILFFVFTIFYPNFIHPSIFYFTMAIWGISLGGMDIVRSYKKKRI